MRCGRLRLGWRRERWRLRASSRGLLGNRWANWSELWRRRYLGRLRLRRGLLNGRRRRHNRNRRSLLTSRDNGRLLAAYRRWHRRRLFPNSYGCRRLYRCWGSGRGYFRHLDRRRNKRRRIHLSNLGRFRYRFRPHGHINDPRSNHGARDERRNNLPVHLQAPKSIKRDSGYFRFLTRAVKIV